MKSIHIRDIDTETIDSLKRLAVMHHRSLQGELRSILTTVARMAPPPEKQAGLTLKTVNTKSNNTWTREEIYGDHAR